MRQAASACLSARRSERMAPPARQSGLPAPHNEGSRESLIHLDHADKARTQNAVIGGTAV
jgi:hypothetical protein